MKNSIIFGIVLGTILLAFSISATLAGNEKVNATTSINMTNATLNITMPQNVTNVTTNVTVTPKSLDIKKNGPKQTDATPKVVVVKR